MILFGFKISEISFLQKDKVLVGDEMPSRTYCGTNSVVVDVVCVGPVTGVVTAGHN